MAIKSHHLTNENGQSILEVVFVLPFLFLFVGLLFKLNLSVQQSINNTQYARSQVYMLTNNSAEYPRLQFRENEVMFRAQGQDLMILGVSDPSAIDSSQDTSKIDPIPQTQKIGRNRNVKGSEDRGEVAKRSEIRVRNTSAICTQLNNVPLGSTARWPFGQAVCAYKGMEGS